MAGTKITSSGRMAEVASKLEEIIHRYNQSLANMNNIGAEVDSMWDGEASQKFVSQMSDDQTKFKALTTILNQYVETLRKDIQIYEMAEEEAKNTILKNKV